MIEVRSPVAPSVTLGGGYRPESNTQVRLDAFEGPLALLLSLIEARQLDVMTVPLGALAEAYLDALAGLETDRIGNVSGFIAIAGQLILIKSRALLPRRWTRPWRASTRPRTPRPSCGRGSSSTGRTATPAWPSSQGPWRVSAYSGANRPRHWRRVGRVPSRRPPRRWIRGCSAASLERLLRVVPPPPPPPEAMPRTVSIAQRAELIRAALRGADRIVLQELLAGVRDRIVVVVTFLAMLELMKRREIVVEQEAPWGPIVARPTTAEERAAMGGLAPDEPIDESLESFA